MGRAIRVESLIRAPPDVVRQAAQEPERHVRWDLRFTAIEPLPRDPGKPQRFRYTTRMGAMSIEGWGETVADRDDLGSGLRFGSESPRSLIREGAGSWRYEAVAGGTRFATVYDYKVRGGAMGRLVDAVAFRPAMTWATRWSFDRLRLATERGIDPKLAWNAWLAKRACAVALGLVWILAGLLPKVDGVRPSEVDLVARSGLAFGHPAAVLAALGWAEVAIGLWLILGGWERAAVVLATGLMAVLAGLVAWLDPTWWTDPYSGLVKNLGLVAVAGVVYWLSGWTPKASRARPRTHG